MLEASEVVVQRGGLDGAFAARREDTSHRALIDAFGFVEPVELLVEDAEIVEHCRDLDADPALWQSRLFEGVCQLLGVPVATGGEGLWNRPHRSVEALSIPCFRTRRQLVSDAVWYRAAAWEYRYPIGIDDQLTSIYQISDDGAVSVIALHRATGEQEFSARVQRLMAFFHEELGRLIGRALVSVTEPSPDKLAPRLRQTLACLLEGDSEKQVAARLGLSRAPTYQYVTALYRHFKVRSRA